MRKLIGVALPLVFTGLVSYKMFILLAVGG